MWLYSRAVGPVTPWSICVLVLSSYTENVPLTLDVHFVGCVLSDVVQLEKVGEKSHFTLKKWRSTDYLVMFNTRI